MTKDLYGWKNDEKYRALKVALRAQFAALEQNFAAQIAHGRQATPAEAFWHIIDGEYPSDASGEVYAYVVRTLVSKWGSCPTKRSCLAEVSFPTRWMQLYKRWGPTPFGFRTCAMERCPCHFRLLWTIRVSDIQNHGTCCISWLAPARLVKALPQPVTTSPQRASSTGVPSTSASRRSRVNRGA
jgi:hypothetical protein